ncbi:F1-ATP synthase assembly protein [Handroanthus impetiginosus]|uniref:F1-ATP synthase assembly protein n=1 Tax=Handroanthus impetiginosus TaxID=429701 RepID=A0A2G9GNY4_9LAMI|nr:F1-ATP synthase assembly protein [Handroanthus impetiginosus]
MASSMVRKTLQTLNAFALRTVTSTSRHFSFAAEAGTTGQDPSSFTFSSDASEHPKLAATNRDENIYIQGPQKKSPASSSVTMPMSFMTGSIVGKRFYKNVTTREAEDGNGWNVMLDYRTLKTPSKRNLKCPTLALAKAIAAEWEFQQTEGIRPFTMPLMKLACTALERVPVTRPKIIEHLMKKFHQDLIFCHAPRDNDLTKDVRGLQVEKFGPITKWMESEFSFKPVVYTSFFGGKQEQGLVNAIENLLKKMDNCELAAIDAIAAAAHSLVIAIVMFRGRLDIEQAIELIRLEEDFQVDRWGLVEGGHDVDIADLRVQISSAAVFLGLSRKH